MIISPALNRACKAAGITTEELRKSNKRRDVTSRRFHAYWHMVVVEGFSYPKAARLVHRDHTTLMYGCRQHSMAHYRTREKASLAEMLSAYADSQKHDPWIEAYGDRQIPQAAVENWNKAGQEAAA